MLKKDGGITHFGDLIEEDEEPTPTMDNVTVLHSVPACF